MKANQIRLLDEKGRAQEVIDLYPESKLPRMVFFPAKNIGLGFSDFQEIDGIYYARRVKVEDMGGKSNLMLRNKKMVFNKTIPQEVFHLEENPNEAGPSLQ
jgi:hypothetical protein